MVLLARLSCLLPPEPAVPAMSDLPVFDEEALLEDTGYDDEFVVTVIDLFLPQVDELLAEIRQALSRGDAPGVYHAAHTMKGSAGGLHLPATYEAALRLETIGRSGDLSEAPAALAALETELQRAIAALRVRRAVSAGETA